jgi:hypothetical protein
LKKQDQTKGSSLQSWHQLLGVLHSRVSPPYITFPFQFP